MTRRIAISVGHGLHIRGASGSPKPPQVDEVDEAKKIVDRVAELLGCVKFFDTNSTSQSQNLNAITSWHNKQSRDLDVSCHWNAFDHSAHGTEILYVTQEALQTMFVMPSVKCLARHLGVQNTGQTLPFNN